MQKIEIHTKSRPSSVYCGEGAFLAAQQFLGENEVFVVTDENVWDIYGEDVEYLFPKAHVCILPAGEKHKNKSSLFRILDEMLAAGLHRSSYVVALGGGVVGDMAGLAAALYMRGTHLIQIPTTLLAQVDSSVGGKTAIDHKNVKNVLGAFYQPERVYCDPKFLQTLPPREIRCGLGEIIKTGVLDGALGEKILQNADKLTALDFLRSLVTDCVRFKARVVERDETESSGLRKCLNLGHTTGHALELRYGRRSHGEYVLIGMWLESYIAEGEGVATAEHSAWVRSLVSLAEKKIPAFPNVKECVSNALLDKKNDRSGVVSVVLSKAKGEFEEYALSSEKYAEYLSRLEEGRR